MTNIDYNIKIISLNKLSSYTDENGNQYENVVTKINYQYIGVCDNITRTFNSSVNLDKPSNANYINFSELTEEALISWIKNSIPNDEIIMIEKCIENSIEDAKTITTLLPWQ